MSTLRAVRIRIYPTLEQESAFRRISGCCRLVYNLGLYQRQNFHRQYRRNTGHAITWISQKRELPSLKKDFPFLEFAPAHCLQMALKDLQTAYQRFFDGDGGHPRPRRKADGDSFHFPDPAQIRICPKTGNLCLPKFGKSKTDNGPVRGVFHRPLYGKVRSVTIIREGGHWYASVLLKVKRKAKIMPLERIDADLVEGYDRNVNRPIVNSLNEDFGQAFGRGKARKQKRRMERERRLHRALSRKKKGSNNRRKAAAKLAAFKAREARCRRDVLNKVTTRIARTKDVAVLEDLKLKNMTASAKGTVEDPGRNVASKASLNGSMLDKGHGMFERMLEYKMPWNGKRLIKVNPRFTSQTCPASACRHCSPNNRPETAVFCCESCGLTLPADQAAALEIRTRGLALLGLEDTRAHRKEWSVQPVEPSELSWLKQEDQNDGVSDYAPA